ncbi:hypothetical protein L3Y34_000447 [Caenorhabditis briggsae]|uniref:Uncharacterized protein n=1 Tax=Caenorhabditis briggsae TaxID=6238 RepID=A0AAE9IMD0_CAEBR|nr:hypothetical protein L3Y34_000447 [Caenorhabditis briggsae]
MNRELPSIMTMHIQERFEMQESAAHFEYRTTSPIKSSPPLKSSIAQHKFKSPIKILRRRLSSNSSSSLKMSVTEPADSGRSSATTATASTQQTLQVRIIGAWGQIQTEENCPKVERMMVTFNYIWMWMLVEYCSACFGMIDRPYMFSEFEVFGLIQTGRDKARKVLQNDREFDRI